jgi:hypothetical protein
MRMLLRAGAAQDAIAAAIVASLDAIPSAVEGIGQRVVPGKGGEERSDVVVEIDGPSPMIEHPILSPRVSQATVVFDGSLAVAVPMPMKAPVATGARVSRRQRPGQHQGARHQQPHQEQSSVGRCELHRFVLRASRRRSVEGRADSDWFPARRGQARLGLWATPTSGMYA